VHQGGEEGPGVLGAGDDAAIGADAEVPVGRVGLLAALIVCNWLKGVSASSVCPLACAAMIPAMVAAMFYRLDVYTMHVSLHSRAVQAQS
jgi:hypothetical protein